MIPKIIMVAMKQLRNINNFFDIIHTQKKMINIYTYTQVKFYLHRNDYHMYTNNN